MMTTPMKSRLACLFGLLLPHLAAAAGLAVPEIGGLQFLPYQAKEGTAAGQLAGKVLLGVPPPPRLPIKRDRDQKVCGDKAPDESLLVDAHGGVANVLVMMEVPSGEKLAPVRNAQLDQRACSYRPHVQALPVGSSLTVLNSDPMLHTVHSWMGADSLFNQAQPLKGLKKTVELKKPGLLTIRCDLHGWMLAFIAVSTNPYFAVTGSDGTFHIDRIPPGTYTVQIWHERLGLMEAEVTIAEGAPATLEVKYPRVP